MTFQATMYLLWTPSGVSSPIPVPLGSIQWGWTGAATQNLSTGVWSLSQNVPNFPNQGSASGFAPSSTYPTWDTTQENGFGPCS